ncbi:MAG: hypothetical protein HYV41_00300, partial [Candidatus Magasanikbacteria bacterium]|nr:hypothetical protein [Candidatus Magasanikbacteria bacterium]
TDKVEANSKAIDVLSQQIKTHEVKITELGAVVETNANTLDRLVIKVIHIEERLNNTLTEEQFVERADKIFGRVDRFVKLHESLDTELCALRHYYARLEDRVVVLERQAGMWR